MIIKTGSFGSLEISEQDIIQFPLGIHGFPEEKEFCLIDPADDTLILWLQSTRRPELAFAVLEPKIFKSDYMVRLSGAELRELKLENLSGQASVFSILTLPQDLQGMTANLKAPIVINLVQKLGRQVVLQENDYSLKHLMFQELKAHLVSMQSQRERGVAVNQKRSVVHVQDLVPSASVRSLQA